MSINTNSSYGVYNPYLLAGTNTVGSTNASKANSNPAFAGRYSQLEEKEEGFNWGKAGIITTVVAAAAWAADWKFNHGRGWNAIKKFFSGKSNTLVKELKNAQKAEIPAELQAKLSSKDVNVRKAALKELHKIQKEAAAKAAGLTEEEIKAAKEAKKAARKAVLAEKAAKEAVEKGAKGAETGAKASEKATEKGAEGAAKAGKGQDLGTLQDKLNGILKGRDAKTVFDANATKIEALQKAAKNPKATAKQIELANKEIQRLEKQNKAIKGIYGQICKQQGIKPTVAFESASTAAPKPAGTTPNPAKPQVYEQEVNNIDVDAEAWLARETASNNPFKSVNIQAKAPKLPEGTAKLVKEADGSMRLVYNKPTYLSDSWADVITY